MDNKKLLTIIGMGEKNGLALARQFGKNNFIVAMLARSEDKLEDFQQQLEREGVESYYYLANADDADSIREGLRYVKGSLGETDVLIYNAAVIGKTNLSEMAVNKLVDDFRVNVIGAIVAAQEVLPAMEARKAGKIFFTGGGLSINPDSRYGSLGIGKAGLRNAAYSLHQEVRAKGIHVATVTIQGFIQEADEKYNPAAIAEQFWQLYEQREDFDIEIQY
ncbi:SDR family NAD(P)-dependent oxidoreductase [Tunicatimonas pelagia]|uniref:SDR family NAD(P)-dependent oxidoreductase n=1 Tax=Tunicatimonas pelagia TaxID=931531 RepID=UPI0026659509|nr:SDR family NAD(P)-dependent oxidoreductase [Tunicatimonas pelagia]WKN41762.1 SDR family NAD(P)-dependent oxidoreductase [Tunicatimonas pelagia]